MTSTLTTTDKVDAIHRFCTTLPPADCPVTHRFTPGLYVREIFMPKGSLVISKIHRTEHPFVVLSGEAAVWDERNGVQSLRAGHVGITQPGTRRILYIKEDCRWVTFHPTSSTDVAAIEQDIIEPHTVPQDGAADVTLVNLLQNL